MQIFLKWYFLQRCFICCGLFSTLKRSRSCWKNFLTFSSSKIIPYPNRFGIKPQSKLTLTRSSSTTGWMLSDITSPRSMLQTIHCAFLGFPKQQCQCSLTPHSNAQEERIFSMVCKNKTAFQPSLDPKGTLSSILTVKLANDMPAYQFEPTKDLLKTAKSTTWKYNKEHLSHTQ